jgi:hypothetical protein
MSETMLRCALIACLATLAVGGRSRAAPPSALADGDWRAARWGMTEDEVLKAFAGEAVRLEKRETLADGNVVALGIEKQTIRGTEFRVRFVFDPAGKLALVSLRTPPQKYATPEVFAATREALSERLGPPAASSSDDNFIDMRQASWWTARSRVDAKFIPGVVAVIYAPTDGGPPPGSRASTGVPPLLAKPPEVPGRK